MITLWGDALKGEYITDENGAYNRAIPCWCAIEQITNSLNGYLGWGAECSVSSGMVSIEVKRNGDMYELVNCDIWDKAQAYRLFNRLKFMEQHLELCPNETRKHQPLTT